jgi:hypothetical protein
MKTLLFSKKPWRIINSVIEKATANSRQIIDNDIIVNIIKLDKNDKIAYDIISVDSILTILAIHSWSLLRLLPGIKTSIIITINITINIIILTILFIR